MYDRLGKPAVTSPRHVWLSMALCALFAVPAFAENHLRMEIGVFNWSEAPTHHFMSLSVNKDTATTASLTTHLGTYDLITYNSRGDWTYPPQFRNDHGMEWSFPQLLEIASHDWVIVFDDGLPTQTEVTIDFGQLTAGDFSRIPMAVSPIPDAELMTAEAVIEWAYEGMTVEEAQTDRIEAFLYDHPSVDLIASGNLPLTSSSWAPEVPLAEGDWKVYVRNRTVLRDTADDLLIDGDPWILPDTRWLVTWCGTGWGFAVSAVGTASASWSAVKSAYH